MMKNYLLTVKPLARVEETTIASGIPADQLMEVEGICFFTEINNAGLVTTTPIGGKFNSLFNS